MGFKCRNLRLDEDGLAKALGPLEADVMEAVWSRASATVRDVREAIRGRKRYSFNTVMTIMNRLVAKGLLAKRSVDGTFAYAAKISRKDFIRDINRSVVGALLKDGTLFQAAAFIDAVRECSEEELRLLRQVIDREG